MKEEIHKFKDERCNHGLQDLLLSFKCLDKLVKGDTEKLTEKEMNALHDVAYLPFDNYHGEEIPHIGHLTLFGKRKVFEHYRTEILEKSEHIIKSALHY